MPGLPADPNFWKILFRSILPLASSGLRRQEPDSSAKPIWMNSPWVRRMKILPMAQYLIRGILHVSPEVRPVGAQSRLLSERLESHLEQIPVALFASLRR